MDTGKVIAPEITDSKNGCYEVKYKPKIAGKYEVFITVDGDVIVDSPFRLEVKAKTRQKKVQKRKVIGKPVFSSGIVSLVILSQLNKFVCVIKW